MHSKSSSFCLLLLILVGMVMVPDHAQALDAPLIRMKTGFSSLKVNAGALLKNASLSSAITLQPSILWEVPQFSARLGVNFLMELQSAYGMTPLSGIGFTGYYHLSGVSTTYRQDEDGTLIQKSKPGLFLAGSLTPANMNINILSETGTVPNRFFSRAVFDLSTGVGYDYPIASNMILSGELMLRTGAGADTADPDKSINYSGFTFFLSFATSYY